MSTTQTAQADRVTDGRGRAMLSVDDVAGELNCSPRHVHRLVDSGGMPPPIKLGTLCRWLVPRSSGGSPTAAPIAARRRGGRR